MGGRTTSSWICPPPEQRAAIGVKNTEGDGTVTPAAAENAMEGVELSTQDTSKDVKISTDPPALEKTAEDERVEFYQTFWSVQKPFSNPSLFQNTDTFGMFRTNVSKIILTLSEATKRDRLSSTSKSATPTPAVGAKRKRDETDGAGSEASSSAPPQKSESTKDYFFAKFLTNYDLLELEVRISSFAGWGDLTLTIVCDRPFLDCRHPLSTADPHPDIDSMQLSTHVCAYREGEMGSQSTRPTTYGIHPQR